EVKVYLPSDPRQGQLHFIKDASGFADATLPIRIIPQTGIPIDDLSEKQLIDPYGSMAVFWFAGAWHALVPGLGDAAPVDATFLTVTTSSTLTNERYVTSSFGLTLIDSGSGNAFDFRVNDNEIATLS